MEHNQQNEAYWDRALKAFFRPVPKPTAQATELFVSRVMARLTSAEVPLDSVRDWFDFSWMVPTLSFTVALLFLAITFSDSETIAPLDALFLMDAPQQDVSELIVPPDSGVELLAFVSETK